MRRQATPLNCNYCQQPAELVLDSTLIYGKNYGPVHICSACDAYVGCHPGTTRPLGILANAKLRRMKMQLHRLFDPHWQKPLKEQAPEGNPPPGLKTYLRRQAYKQLASALHISEGECHFGKFDEAMATRALEILRSDFRVASTP